MASRRLPAGRAGRQGRPGRAGGGGKRAPRHRPRTLLRAAIRVSVLTFLWGVILGIGVLGYFALTLPNPEKPLASPRRPRITILAADGAVIANLGDPSSRPLRLAEISPYLPEAVVATEDRRFYSNFGLDPVGILRAALTDLFARRVVEGGSTITQQLAKILFLSRRQTLARKVREALLALWLDRHFSKKEILEIYLNRVYFGAGAYGVDAAAHRYFAKSARRLSLYESAMLAGLLKAPALLNPFHDPARAAARTGQVLANMVDASFITAREAAAALRTRTALAQAAPRRPGSRYFADWIAGQLARFVGADHGDLTVWTTLDPNLQREAEAAVSAVLSRDGIIRGVGEGALLAMSPRGAVKAMVGGRSYDSSQFNRVTEAERPPGSAFKPFVYLAGLEAGLSPSDRFYDGPVRIGNWRPRNFTRRYLGEVTMAQGLAQSINTVAVEVAERAGFKHVIAVARRLGIDSPLAPHPSVALGADAVNLLELTGAYAAFANGGYGVVPYGITEIRDKHGRVLYRHQGTGPGRVIAPELVAPMNAMLSAVIAGGTGSKAALSRPAAGKTGTSEDYRDAWFIGYTAGLVAGVWLGNDDDAPMKSVVGGSLPAEAWRRFMLAATRGMPVRSLPGSPPLAASAQPERPGLGAFLGRLFGFLSSGPPPSRPR